MIKKIVALLVALALLLIIAIAVLVFVTPTDFRVERETTINKPRADVFNYAKFLKNQNDWGPWAKKDPNIKQTYRGNDGEVGFVSAWESLKEDVGSGEQEIKAISDKRIDTELRFKIPFESTSQAYFIMDEVTPSQTKVKWGFTGSMPRPFNLMTLFVDMDKEVGKDFDEGLKNLKIILEK